MSTGWFLSFTKRPPLKREHPLFGELVYSRHDGWTNDQFSLWGFANVGLQVDAGPEGPSPLQEQAFQAFEKRRDDLLPRCLKELDGVRQELGAPPSEFAISALTIPSLQKGPQADLWTLWFDLTGDSHFMYGIQTDDAWETLVGFADD